MLKFRHSRDISTAPSPILLDNHPHSEDTRKK